MRKIGFIGILVAALGAAAYFGVRAWSAKETGDRYRVAAVERGAITAAVSASGTVNPVKQVVVGTQVSGQIKEISADFNTAVKKDQLLARVDPDPYDLRIRQASADLEAARATVLSQQSSVASMRAEVARARVNLEDADRDWARKRSLYEKNFISSAERDKAKTTFDAADAEVNSALAQLGAAQALTRNGAALIKQREAQLEQTKVDLEKTYIRSPVDGIVIKRSVDAGQTVAASFQTPELFLIAENLTEMQVEASIDEADVGRLASGQQATFTVDAFPGKTYQGSITQIRKAPTVQQNVVTYVAVIRAPNPELQLLPGMTTTVKINVGSRDNVLKVPAAALRFRPPVEKKDSVSAGPGEPSMGRETPPRPPSAGQSGKIYVMDSAGAPKPVTVEVGLSDGSMTEIVTTQVAQGAQVVIGLKESPAQKTQQQGPRMMF